MNSKTAAQTKIEQWLDTAVIGLNLCPFAAKPRDNGQVRIHINQSNSLEALLEELIVECYRLEQAEPTEIETTLFAATTLLRGWDQFLDVLSVAESLLVEQGFEGRIQIASFHPKYQFDGTECDDRENLTNRSPYPLFHLLREASLEKAIAAFGDTTVIPERNIETLNQLTAEQIQKIFADKAIQVE